MNFKGFFTMEKYDILLTYETKNREIENLCLVKRELERRGYSVGVKMQYSTYFETPEPIEAKLIVIPAYYRPRAKFYTSSHLTTTKKIFDLRWEQVFNNQQEENPNTLSSIKEWGRDAVHIAWGKRPYDRMINEWGVPEQNVKLTGHMTLDYLRGKLRNYFDDKETVFKRYGLPEDKRVNLFISSLSFVTMHSHVVINSASNGKIDTMMRLVEVAKATQKEILSWFEQILDENPNDIIIYRPHPEEKSSELLKKLSEKQPRFYVISEESVKQWILISDKIYTWISTSTAEVYAAGKGCSILRPVEVPHENDMRLYSGAPALTNYEEFKEEFNKNNQEFAISKDMIEQYYYINPERYSYELVCDAIEEVLNDDKYLLNKELPNPFNGLINVERIKNFIKRSIAKSKFMNSISEKDKFKGSKFRYLLDDVIYVKNKLEKNSVTDEEIEKIIKKIDSVLN